jgi:hypothetical protein
MGVQYEEVALPWQWTNEITGSFMGKLYVIRLYKITGIPLAIELEYVRQ